jgi:CRP-like cAMP-binding protein
MLKVMANKKSATTKNQVAKTTNKVSLMDIRRKLKYGEITKIANKTGYSPEHVSNVLNGRRNNNQIVKEAASITRRRK